MCVAWFFYLILAVEHGGGVRRYPQHMVRAVMQRQPDPRGQVQVEGGELGAQLAVATLLVRHAGQTAADRRQRRQELEDKMHNQPSPVLVGTCV